MYLLKNILSVTAFLLLMIVLYNGFVYGNWNLLGIIISYIKTAISFIANSFDGIAHVFR